MPSNSALGRLTAWKRWRARANKLRTHPEPIRFLVSRVLWHTGVSERFSIALPHGLRMRFYPSSMSAALWVSPHARNDDAEFLGLVLAEGDTYLDCGANIGHLAIVARALIGATGAAIAIEANPRIYRYCIGNLELNGFTDVVTHNIALGAEAGSIRISDRRDDDQNHVGDDGVVVEMRPLDAVVGAQPVTLLKIDVEGYEVNVLRGAANTLTRTAMIYCELSPTNASRFGTTPREIESLLLGAGFVFAQRDGLTWTISHRPVFPETANTLPNTGYNLVGIKADAIELFTSRVARRGHHVVTSRG
jgi:FkbM family methyltransferase